MADEESNQSNHPNTPADPAHNQSQDQEATPAPKPKVRTVLPARNPQMALDHALDDGLPDRNPQVGLKTQKGNVKKQQD